MVYMRSGNAVLLGTYLLYLSGVSAYVWPSPYDFLEDAYTVSAGFAAGGIVAGVNPCGASPFGFLPGRQAAAEWLRLAYHDMATHNTETGFGGLDASVGFETDRAQNIGTAMNTSLVFFSSFQSKNSSMSDVMALGVILAMKNCGGPTYPSAPANRLDLASHTAAYALQGFNVTEMIGLVACGHTLGGVHQVDFPLTVQNAIVSGNPEGVVHFDDSFNSFDNHIATQWIDGTSVDPLAVGFNETTNSDARIFAADGNATMSAFAQDPAFFASQCSSLLERMLNTVPKAVELSEVIEPLEVKPHQLALSLQSNGSLAISGYIRIFGTSTVAASATATSMPVMYAVLIPHHLLTWTDRFGHQNAAYTTTATAVSTSSASLWGSVRFFSINAPIDVQLGISSFVVDWAFDTQDSLTHADNEGKGFPLQDVVLFQAAGSCVTSPSIANGNTTTAAVIRNDLGTIASAYIDYSSNVVQPGSVSVKQVTSRIPLVRVGNSSSPLYDTYTATFPTAANTNAGKVTFDMVAVIGGEMYKSLNNPQILTTC